jgi:hypothetical protein
MKPFHTRISPIKDYQRIAKFIWLQHHYLRAFNSTQRWTALLKRWETEVMIFKQSFSTLQLGPWCNIFFSSNSFSLSGTSRLADHVQSWVQLISWQSKLDELQGLRPSRPRNVDLLALKYITFASTINVFWLLQLLQAKYIIVTNKRKENSRFHGLGVF